MNKMMNDEIEFYVLDEIELQNYKHNRIPKLLGNIFKGNNIYVLTGETVRECGRTYSVKTELTNIKDIIAAIKDLYDVHLDSFCNISYGNQLCEDISNDLVAEVMALNPELKQDDEEVFWDWIVDSTENIISSLTTEDIVKIYQTRLDD